MVTAGRERARTGGRGVLGRAAVLCGAVTLAAALSGCGGGDGDDKPSAGPSAAAKASTAAPSASARSTAPAGPDAAEKAAVLTSYDRMWAEQMKAYRKASLKGTDVEKYATLDALGQFKLDLAHLESNGTVIKGDMGHEVKVTGLDLEAKTSKATLSDCVDLSKWKTYDVKARKMIPLPSAQPLRYVATATAEKWDGRWMVTAFKPDGDRPC
ncbi:hypothetical protein AB0M05_47320 [Streptomyces violaceusniger]|uniref:hypothetical protein n=1 Tax=Streptomyces violaceusniger TaxID=68280 RepID=UPI00341FEAFE